MHTIRDKTLGSAEGSSEPYYKGYYLMTSRCNLDCDYCVLEDAPDQLRKELDLDGKKALIAHLYEHMRFRHLTLSGGEVLLIGKRPPADFVELLRYLRGFRSDLADQNLGVAVYSNGTYLSEAVADEFAGVVDVVAVTIDTADDALLSAIGRNKGRHQGYFKNAVSACGVLGQRGVRVKLHSVIGQMNQHRIAGEVRMILDAVQSAGGQITKWKFYQYMSYDDPRRDGAHAIGSDAYRRARDGISTALAGSGVSLHFKDNEEMNDSLFNILPYGNAQFLRTGDTWSTSQRTSDLRQYGSMSDLFAHHAIDSEAFRRFHAIQRRAVKS